jgi:hypothetical protein
MSQTQLPTNNVAPPKGTYAEVRGAQADTLTPAIKEINDCLTAIKAAETASGKAVLVQALRVGNLLKQIKNDPTVIKHGDWADWLKTNCNKLSDRTAQRYMRLADNRTMLEEHMKSKSATVADLTIREAEALIKRKKGNGSDKSGDKSDKSGKAKPDGVDKLISKGGATNDPEAAGAVVTTTQETLLKALKTYKRNHEEEARAVAAEIVKRLRDMGLIDDDD